MTIEDEIEAKRVELAAAMADPVRCALGFYLTPCAELTLLLAEKVRRDEASAEGP